MNAIPSPWAVKKQVTCQIWYLGNGLPTPVLKHQFQQLDVSAFTLLSLFKKKFLFYKNGITLCLFFCVL